MIATTTYVHDYLGKLTIACEVDDDSGDSCGGSRGGASHGGIVGLWMDGQKYFGSGLPQPFVPRDDEPTLVQARAWLDRYFAGERPDPRALPLAPRGTAFQRRVWSILLTIPYGQLRTYADIAAQIAREDGAPHGSARAVGTANGRNPVSIIIPCHRVVGSGGSLTGYAGGVDRKLWLLRHEGAVTARLFVPTRGTAL